MSNFSVRKAQSSDNQGLIDLARACPMTGDIGLCVDRSPDFFTLNRLEGDEWTLGVVESDGRLVGCMAASRRTVYVNGEARTAAYVGDLKVHPAYRDHAVADALIRFATEESRQLAGEDAPVYFTALAGNTAVEKRASGLRGLPRFEKVATLTASSVSLLWKKRPPAESDLFVRAAVPADAEPMASLWRSVASNRQLASVHDAESFRSWIENAPSLDWSAYRLAFDRRGRLLGFLALWDQDSFKHMQVTYYSKRVAAFRLIYNAVSPLIGASRLPAPGGVMRYLSAVNICVGGDRPDVLHALLVQAYNDLRGKDYTFFTVGLDVNDPLNAALRGFMPQPMRINLYLSGASGSYAGAPLDGGRPFHFEIALV